MSQNLHRFALAATLAALCAMQSHSVGAQTPSNAQPPALLADANRPPEMDRVLTLAGTWKMTPSYVDSSGQWREGAILHAHFAARYGGRYLHSEFVMPMEGLPAFLMDWTWSYDRYRKVYRVAILENVVGLMDLYEGEWQGDLLMLDDKRTGTSAPGPSGELVYGRFVFRFESPTRVHLTMQAWRKDAWVDGIRIAMDRQAL